MAAKIADDLMFKKGDKRMYKGHAYEVIGYRGRTLGVYEIVRFPLRDDNCEVRTVPRIVFERLSTELTGMVGAIYGP